MSACQPTSPKGRRIMPESYLKSQSDLERWEKITIRQRLRDAEFLTRLARYFRPGWILELGAGCGNLTSILIRMGRKVLATDIEPLFLEYLSRNRIPCCYCSAEAIGETFRFPVENILTQGLTPLISRDLGLVERTYSSIYSALAPGGRFIFIFPQDFLGKRYSKMSDHIPILSKFPFSNSYYFNNHIFPTNFYTESNRKVIGFLDYFLGKFFGFRTILILTK